jgi:CBS domain-containing protein
MRESELLGIVTETDMVSGIVAVARDPESATLADIMTPNPPTVSADETLVTTLNIMTDHRVRHLPVVDGGQVVALVSMRDLPAQYRLMRENWIQALENTGT